MPTRHTNSVMIAAVGVERSSLSAGNASSTRHVTFGNTEVITIQAMSDTPAVPLKRARRASVEKWNGQKTLRGPEQLAHAAARALRSAHDLSDEFYQQYLHEDIVPVVLGR